MAHELKAFRAQLAELRRQEPVGAFHITDGEVEATTDYCAPGKFPIQNGLLEVYARPAPPAASQPVSSEMIECWSCKKALTLQQRLEADGMCPHCDAEIELDDAPASQPYTVPDERPADSSDGNDAEAWFDEGWNSCRAAMLAAAPQHKGE
ncbi:protein Eaa [Pectobacterium carotovorum]|uniref:protein Eaa n=1 Tax=Pectobacterium carotovorum TaxID=554 RepID=UPI00301B2FA9